MDLEAIAKFKAVAERDVDLLLLEEFDSGSGFFEWFVRCTVNWSDLERNEIRVWHSISSDSGESDVVVVAKTPGGRRRVLLVENKIDAPPQPEQAARYFLRGETGIARGHWHEFSVCLVAPRKYLGSARNASGYLHQIAYEDIITWFDRELPASRRTDFKCHLIQAAIDQSRRGYVGETFEPVARFFAGYRELANSLFPELNFSAGGTRSRGSDWAVFKPANLGKNLIRHKLYRGVVDLELTKRASQLPELIRLNAHVLGAQAAFVKTQASVRSAMIRLVVPPIKRESEFTGQRDAALAGLKAAFKLMTLYPQLVLPPENHK